MASRRSAARPTAQIKVMGAAASRALAMLKDKKVEMPAKKHDNLPL
jgi:hypothetical protein